VVTRGEIKIWLRSRSWKFMKNVRGKRAGGEIESYHWRGQPIYYRSGTSDARSIYEILLTPGCEYRVPEPIRPKVILDIGGNIGSAAIYYALCFPQAQIYCFEPIEENFALLRKNISPYQSIQAFPVALGTSNRFQEIFASDNPRNFGGFSFFSEGSNPSVKRKVQIKNARDYLCEIGVKRADLIKIDTEGSEYDILTAMGLEMLRETTWIVGELHGVRDFELLGYLSPHFDISVKKTLRKRLFIFRACNKNFQFEGTLGF
jgi:FkbM family methyltransferase